MSLHYLLFSNKSHTTCAVTPAKHSPHAFLLCSIFSFLSVTSALFSHFLISILCSSEQRVRISSRKEECLILHVLHVLQLYISLAWRRVFLSQRSGCLGRVLGTIQRERITGLTGLTRETTPSPPFFPFSLCLSLCHITNSPCLKQHNNNADIA